MMPSWGSFQSAQGKLERLGTVANVSEYEVEEDGSYRWQMWAWTGAGVGATTTTAGATR